MRLLHFVGFAALFGCSTVVSEPAAPTTELPAVSVKEQEILTPIPIRIDLPPETKTAHVFAVYKTWGNQGWRDIELSRRGTAWSGEISCREVSTVTGDARFFLVALDAEGRLVNNSGTPDAPHMTRIVSKLDDGAQSFAGAPIPVRCFDPSDCPSDLAGAGCPVHPRKRSSCDSDRDCGNASCAWDGYCLSAPERVIPDGDLTAAVEAVSSRMRADKRR